MTAKLYFAYGSNLNLLDWSQWCQKHRASPSVLQYRSVGYLPDHDVCFSYRSRTRQGGVLDIVPRTGQLVPGVIFEVHGDGWEQLDRKEGAPHCYERVPAIALDEMGNEYTVETYRVRPDRRERFVAPHPDYVSVVREGLQNFDLSTDLLEAAALDKPTPWLVDAFFVYGTLMRGESRFPVLTKFGLSCSLLAQTFGRLVDLGNYPGFVEIVTSRSLVQGEFVRVQDLGAAVEAIDAIEGFCGFGRSGSLYRRALCQVDVGEGRIRSAWTYCLAEAGNGATPIPSSDWREHRGIRTRVLRELAEIHAQGNERQLARGIATRIPFSFDPDTEAVVDSLLPLHNSLAQWLVSERKLAQQSGTWSAIF